MSHLSDRDREALHLARDLRDEMHGWMASRGVRGTLGISPFVDPSGQPNVVIRMNAYLARAMVLSLAETAPERRDNGTYRSGDAS